MKNKILIVDYTKLKPSKSGRGLITCPDCGRTGLLTKYTNGDAGIKHIEHAGLFGFVEVTDHCYIKNFSQPEVK